MDFDLSRLFREVNEAHFDGWLDEPTLRWNGRLRTAAGRFIPGSRRWRDVVCAIEIATYLQGEERAEELIRDTLAHEMIHYWLWSMGRPYGHTEQFIAKMRLMGVSRYNSVAKRRPHKYAYRCIHCGHEVRARRKLGDNACLLCCRKYANGRYDRRFRLVLDRSLAPEERQSNASTSPPVSE